MFLDFERAKSRCTKENDSHLKLRVFLFLTGIHATYLSPPLPPLPVCSLLSALQIVSLILAFRLISLYEQLLNWNVQPFFWEKSWRTSQHKSHWAVDRHNALPTTISRQGRTCLLLHTLRAHTLGYSLPQPSQTFSWILFQLTVPQSIHRSLLDIPSHHWLYSMYPIISVYATS